MKRHIGDISVQYVKGVGPALAKELAKLGIYSVRDLLFYFPCGYEDRRKIYKVSSILSSDYDLSNYQVCVKLIDFSVRKRRFVRGDIINAVFSDDSSSICAVWFNQGYLASSLERGKEYLLFGSVRYNPRFGYQMICPKILDRDKADDVVGRILPIYSLGDGKKLFQSRFRKIVSYAIEKYLCDIEDVVCSLLGEFGDFAKLEWSIKQIHFPEDEESLQKAKKRIIFEEFLAFMTVMEEQKRQGRLRKDRNYVEEDKNSVCRYFLERLPFDFTVSQRDALLQLKKDLFSDFSMRQLLQGDVGCGKTAVAFYLCSIVMGSGYSCAFMVPTEILARQHYLKAQDLFPKDKVKLLVGGMKKREKEKIMKEIRNESGLLVIGTHSLIQPDVEIRDLGLVVVDEQHRFGVKQRVSLLERGSCVDLLVMTATPIPRSLAMTLYGDLDLTIISGMPSGRKPVKTYWITPDKRERMYRFIRKIVKEGGQVYIVYPLVSESEQIDLLSAEEMYEELANKVFMDLRVGLLHGKMSANKKAEIMKNFREKRIDILVSTVVIEVGIDVADASVIVIEHAERFGLSQLHQLRGRVGRGERQGYCIVVSSSDNLDTRKRLSAFVKYSDGFKLAEMDLMLRGPGQIFGERQHGPSEFRLGDPLRDFQILCKARGVAKDLLDRAREKNYNIKNWVEERLELGTKGKNLSKIGLSG